MINRNTKLLTLLRKILKRIFLFIGFSIFVLVLFGQEIIDFLWFEFPFMGSDFNQKTWFAALDCTGLDNIQCAYKYENCDRAAMYRDLEKNYLKIGMPKQDVIHLLGGEGKEYHKNTKCFDYPLGYCSGMSIDLDFLSVCYDENNTIKSVGHYQS